MEGCHCWQQRGMKDGRVPLLAKRGMKDGGVQLPGEQQGVKVAYSFKSSKIEYMSDSCNTYYNDVPVGYY